MNEQKVKYHDYFSIIGIVRLHHILLHWFHLMTIITSAVMATDGLALNVNLDFSSLINLTFLSGNQFHTEVIMGGVGCIIKVMRVTALLTKGTYICMR